MVSLPGEIVDMVVTLVEERASLSRGSGGRGLSAGAAAARVGVAPSTLWAWETKRTVPTLRYLVRWAAVLDHRMTLVDFRGLRWDRGIVSFDARHWGDRALLNRFAHAETCRLGAALTQAREATEMPVIQVAARIGAERNRIGLWERGKDYPQLELFVRWAGALGLCASLESVDDLSDEAADYDPSALRPDEEMESSCQ
jgi:transcriptional regulator with XRE-family HTH domain